MCPFTIDLALHDRAEAGLLKVKAEGDQQVLNSLLMTIPISDFSKTLERVLKHTSFDINGVGVDFEEDHVEIYDPISQLQLTLSDFYSFWEQVLAFVLSNPNVRSGLQQEQTQKLNSLLTLLRQKQQC